MTRPGNFAASASGMWAVFEEYLRWAWWRLTSPPPLRLVASWVVARVPPHMGGFNWDFLGWFLLGPPPVGGPITQCVKRDIAKESIKRLTGAENGARHGADGFLKCFRNVAVPFGVLVRPFGLWVAVAFAVC